MIAVAPTQRAGAIRQLSQHAPAAARLLALRLSETGDAPLRAIRDRAPGLTRVGPALRKALPLLAPRAEREIAGGARRILAESIRRDLARYLMRKNQYFPIPRDWHRAVEELYADLLGVLVGRLASPADVEYVLAGHQPRLRSLLAAREGGIPSDFEPVCATYSPALQLRLLGLDPLSTPGPVLDLGCGEGGGLVRCLRELGRDDVVGIDVLCEPGDGLIRASRFDAPLAPGRWGTIIAHQSFSLHFLRAHLHGSAADAARHARAYMKTLEALAPGGSFVYAPALPFFETFLPKETWRVERQDLPVPYGGGPPFQRAGVSRQGRR